MVFTSISFIVFMTTVFTLYYTIPKKYQWILLLISSYIFYAFTSPWYLICLAGVTSVTYISGVLLGKTVTRNSKKVIIVFTVIILLSVLSVFKYLGFILRNYYGLETLVTGYIGEHFIPNIILPIGLSFYIFQSMGYCIDVYREAIVPEYNPFRYALYISFFPQILQGPIGDYERLSHQLFEKHAFSYTEAKYGIQRVTWGFFKKLIVANQITIITESVWDGYKTYSGFVFWSMILVLYAFQLYADFSGYVDIAAGCAQMLGITIDENFDSPYLSRNIPEYWRRWHITLGAWFRNYCFLQAHFGKSCNIKMDNLACPKRTMLQPDPPPADHARVIPLQTGFYYSR